MNPFVGAAFAFAAVVLYLYFKLLRPVGGNILNNGSFEEDGSFQGGASARMTVAAGSSAITSWEVVGQVIWSNEENPRISPPSPKFMDLANRHPRAGGPYGGVKQSVNLQGERDYRLTFQLGSTPSLEPDVQDQFLGDASGEVTIEHGGSVRFSKIFTQPLDRNGPKWTPRF